MFPQVVNVLKPSKTVSATRPDPPDLGSRPERSFGAAGSSRTPLLSAMMLNALLATAIALDIAGATTGPGRAAEPRQWNAVQQRVLRVLPSALSSVVGQGGKKALKFCKDPAVEVWDVHEMQGCRGFFQLFCQKF